MTIVAGLLFLFWPDRWVDGCSCFSCCWSWFGFGLWYMFYVVRCVNLLFDCIRVLISVGSFGLRLIVCWFGLPSDSSVRCECVWRWVCVSMCIILVNFTTFYDQLSFLFILCFFPLFFFVIIFIILSSAVALAGSLYTHAHYHWDTHTWIEYRVCARALELMDS